MLVDGLLFPFLRLSPLWLIESLSKSDSLSDAQLSTPAILEISTPRLPSKAFGRMKVPIVALMELLPLLLAIYRYISMSPMFSCLPRALRRTYFELAHPTWILLACLVAEQWRERAERGRTPPLQLTRQLVPRPPWLVLVAAAEEKRTLEASEVVNPPSRSFNKLGSQIRTLT